MRVRLFICINILSLIVSLFLSCSKGGSDTPIVTTPPADSTATTPPKDTATNPPKDTSTTPPEDTIPLPPKDTTRSMIYKTLVINASQINLVQTGQYYIKYYNSGGYVAQMNSYLTTDASLSSHNLGSITVSIDPNTGNQLLTSSKFTDRTLTEIAPVSDTSKFYYLMLTRHDTTTVIFPDKPIVYQNFSSAITADDEQQINNRTVQIEKLILK